MLKILKPKKSAKPESAENQRPLGDEVTKKICNVAGDALPERNTLQEEGASEQLENNRQLEDEATRRKCSTIGHVLQKGDGLPEDKETAKGDDRRNPEIREDLEIRKKLDDSGTDIEKLGFLAKTIMPLQPGKETEWVMITRELTKHRTIKSDENLILTLILHKLLGHSRAYHRAKILLVQSAKTQGKETDTLEKLYEWILQNYQLSLRQQIGMFKKELHHMHWSWENNPADDLAVIMHAVQLTWEEVNKTQELREELETFLASKLGTSLYITLKERPVNEWYEEITRIYKSQKMNKYTKEEKSSIIATTNTNQKNCFKCGLKGHIAHNCKTKESRKRPMGGVDLNKVSKRKRQIAGPDIEGIPGILSRE